MNRAWMESLITATNDKTESSSEYNRCVIVGKFGAGKTRFCNVPGVFILDFDEGLETLRKGKVLPPVFQMRKGNHSPYERTMGLIKDLMSRGGPFAKGEALENTRVVALDGITSLANILMHEIAASVVGSSDITAFKPEYDEWGMLKKRLETIIDALKQIPYHLIVTAMAKVDKDESTGAYIGMIDILGSYRDEIGPRFDEVYYVEKVRSTPDEKTNTKSEIANVFHTAYHPRFEVKSRLAANHDIPAKVRNPTWTSLIKPHYTKKGGLE